MICCVVWLIELVLLLVQVVCYCYFFLGWLGCVLQCLLDGMCWMVLWCVLICVLLVLLLCSDVCDVIYMIWWVDVVNVFIVLLGYWLFIYVGCMFYMVLIYWYGYFGLVFVGWLCVLFFLLLQSNWCWYLLFEDDMVVMLVVLFDCNVIDSVIYVVGVCLFSDVMQLYWLVCFDYGCSGDGWWMCIELGQGSVLVLQVQLVLIVVWLFDWVVGVFVDMLQVLVFFVCQDVVIVVCGDGCIVLIYIVLLIMVLQVQLLWLVGQLYCLWVVGMGVDFVDVFCFWVLQVLFWVVFECLV